MMGWLAAGHPQVGAKLHATDYAFLKTSAIHPENTDAALQSFLWNRFAPANFNSQRRPTQ